MFFVLFGSVRCGLANRTLIELFGSGRTVKHCFGRSLISSLESLGLLLHAVSDYKKRYYKKRWWNFKKFQETTSQRLKFKKRIEIIKKRSLVRISCLRNDNFKFWCKNLFCTSRVYYILMLKEFSKAWKYVWST